MITIWKFPVKISEERQAIEMPAGAKILDVQQQGGLITLWALVETEAKKTPRIIIVCGTGQPFMGEHKQSVHISTIQIVGAVGTLVLHFFEEIRRPDPHANN